MKIKEIEYFFPSTDLVNGTDLVNDCLDVVVTLENDASYLVEVTTPQFLSTHGKS